MMQIILTRETHTISILSSDLSYSIKIASSVEIKPKLFCFVFELEKKNHSSTDFIVP